MKKFELVFYANEKFKFPDYFPDLIMDASQHLIDSLKSSEQPIRDDYVVTENLSFAQNTFCIHPDSFLFLDSVVRNRVAWAIDSAIRIFAEKKGLALATGMVPVGILGHLIERPKLKPPEQRGQSIINLKIAYAGSVLSDFFRIRLLLKALPHLILPWR